MNNVTLVRSLPEKEWRCFVEAHPEGNIFHTPEMFQVFAQAKGHRPALWAALDGDQRPLALLPPVYVILVDGPLRRFTTRAIAYGSVLCAPGPEAKEALATLLHTYKLEARGDAVFTELRNLSDMDGLQPILNAGGFVYADHLNYLVNLDCSPEAVLQSIGQRTRKKIRHALRQGKVTVEECSRHEQVAVCYRLLQKTYAAAQVPLAGWSLFEAAFDILYPQGMVKFLLARIGDDYAAGSIELIYKDRIYGWYGGMDRAYSEYIPNEMLLWHIFQWGAERGYKVYDFGGAGKPDEKYGVRDFKAKFGGQLVGYGRNVCIHSPAISKLSQSAYAIYRKLL
jgi:serine/alanine adding enzyme